MNFSEFKKLIGADPWNREPETLAARRSAPEFEQAALDAEAFERKLQGALEFTVPAHDMVEELLGMSRQHAQRLPRWLALAASVLIVVGVAGTTWYQVNKPRTAEEYVVAHFLHDGNQVLALAAAGFDSAEVNRILAQFSAVAGNELVDRVRFIKLCPTLHGQGAHMIVDTEAGPVTVIFMPRTPVEDGEFVDFGDSRALLVALPVGSAAIIGPANQAPLGIETLIRNSIKASFLDA